MVGKTLQERAAQSGNADPIVEPLGRSSGDLEDGPELLLWGLGLDCGLVIDRGGWLSHQLSPSLKSLRESRSK